MAASLTPAVTCCGVRCFTITDMDGVECSKCGARYLWKNRPKEPPKTRWTGSVFSRKRNDWVVIWDEEV